MAKLWSLKYEPKRLREVVGQREACRKVLSFLKRFKPGKALLLCGPPGSGKTSLVHALARELDLELVELDASDRRRGKEIEKVVGSAIMQGSIWGRKRIVLIDEIDALSSKDWGGVRVLTKLIKSSTIPIFLTASDEWDPKLRSLRYYSKVIRLRKLREKEIVGFLKKICRVEKIRASNALLEEIARRSEGDLRAAINDLEAISWGKRKVDLEDLGAIEKREREKEIFTSLKKIFRSENAKEALRALDNLNLDLPTSILWIAENLEKEYRSPKEIAQAYDRLSRADVFIGRIRRWQYHRFLLYAKALATAGVALARKKSYPRFEAYQIPSKIRKLSLSKWSRRTAKTIGRKIAGHCHTSSKNAIKYYIPMLRLIFKKDKKKARGIGNQLGLDGREISWLAS